ncbi:MAG: hypothetical protein KBT32_08050 [Bacteroidales bacterium]|nr:hypothetical protein [Candidatus Physcocola equi]
MSIENGNNPIKGDREEVNMLEMLTAAWNKICAFFSNIKKIVYSILRLTYRHKISFVIFLAVGIALAIFQTTGNRRVYQGDTRVRFNAGTSFVASDLISELNNFVKTNDKEALAEALKIDVNTAEKISFIKSFYYIAINGDSTRNMVDFDVKYKLEDTTNIPMNDRLVISLGMTDRSKFAEMQTALSNYFNENPYFRKEFERNYATFKLREEVLDNDLLRLDSLQQIQFFKNQKSEIYLTNITQLRSGMQDLYYNDKQSIINKKEANHILMPVTEEVMSVISPFHPSTKPYKAAKNLAIIYIAALYALFLLVFSFIENKRRIVEFLNK